MSIELKPCPFCGGRLATDGSAPGHADDCYIVLLLRKHGNPDDFHAAWNRRAASDAPAEGREAVDERAAFEADAKRLGMPLENSGGHYANIRTRNRWLGWQARAALSTAPTMSEGVRDAAMRTVQQLGYTYTEGARQWKPPLGKKPEWLDGGIPPSAARGALECLRDVVSHHENIVAGFAAQRKAAEYANDGDDALYWKREIGVANRMKEQAEHALAEINRANAGEGES